MNKKRNLKGVTLAEVIVALAVVSVLTLLLVSVSSTINRYIRSSTNINRKITEQAPIAEVLDEAHSGEKLIENLEITVDSYSGSDPNANYTGIEGSGTVKATLYAVKAKADVESASLKDPGGNTVGKNEDYVAGDNLNLKYAVIEGPRNPFDSSTP